MVRKLNVFKIGLLVLVMSCVAFSVVYAATPSDEAVDKGIQLMSGNKLDEAASEFNKAKTLTPKNSAAYWGLATCASRKGQLDEALVLINKAIELDPVRGMFYDNRAVIYNEKKEYAKSLSDFNTAIKLGFQSNPGFIAGVEASLKQASQPPVSKDNKKI